MLRFVLAPPPFTNRRQNPYAMEAVIALIQLGVNATEVQSLCSKANADWMKPLILAHSMEDKHDYKSIWCMFLHLTTPAALFTFCDIEKQYIDNLHLLKHIARCQVQADMSEQAKRTLERVGPPPHYLISIDSSC